MNKSKDKREKREDKLQESVIICRKGAGQSGEKIPQEISFPFFSSSSLSHLLHLLFLFFSFLFFLRPAGRYVAFANVFACEARQRLLCSRDVFRRANEKSKLLVYARSDARISHLQNEMVIPRSRVNSTDVPPLRTFHFIRPFPSSKPTRPRPAFYIFPFLFLFSFRFFSFSKYMVPVSIFFYIVFTCQKFFKHSKDKQSLFFTFYKSVRIFVSSCFTNNVYIFPFFKLQ